MQCCDAFMFVMFLFAAKRISPQGKYSCIVLYCTRESEETYVLSIGSSAVSMTRLVNLLAASSTDITASSVRRDWHMDGKDS